MDSVSKEKKIISDLEQSLEYFGQTNHLNARNNHLVLEIMLWVNNFHVCVYRNTE